MSHNPFINLLIAGKINQDFIINLSGNAYSNLTGGSLLYAAAGARLLNQNIGLVSRVGSDFSNEDLKAIEKRGLDTNGILALKHVYDVRSFHYWMDANHCFNDNPTAAYSRYGLTFPQELIGYESQKNPMVSKMWDNISPRMNPDFPHEYLDISGAHLCPINLAAHIKLPTILQRGSVNTITISPSDDYMNPENMPQIPAVIKDTTAFLPTETQLCSLFRGCTRDLWEMAEEISKFGCPLIIIERGEKGYWLYDARSKNKLILPCYPSKWQDPTGMNDVFAGAFLGAYKASFDPVQSLIAADAAASISAEGTGAFYCLDGFPGLTAARCEVLQDMIKKA
jgi:sugar/nucleoside kinase (ribokinase family)